MLQQHHHSAGRTIWLAQARKQGSPCLTPVRAADGVCTIPKRNLEAKTYAMKAETIPTRNGEAKRPETHAMEGGCLVEAGSLPNSRPLGVVVNAG